MRATARTDIHRLLDPSLAGSMAASTLRNIAREFPHKLDHVLSSSADLQPARRLHPIFFGSFDWHSCVHGYWQLARLLRVAPDLAERAQILRHFDQALTEPNVAAERDYFERPGTPSFERPYGWAWLLKLAAELVDHPLDPAERWAKALDPLASLLAGRLLQFLPKAAFPSRAGSHANTAFALRLAMDYAAAVDHQDLLRALSEKARRWYFQDADCPAWEPSLEDFLSPALVEAECMRRVLPADEFESWLQQFLPRLPAGEPAALFNPVPVSDPTDGKIVHLVGLNLSRAWCWRGIAATKAPDTELRRCIESTADAHLTAGLSQLFGDYAGEHWLATFALLAMSEPA